jgi:hypothetical protein
MELRVYPKLAHTMSEIASVPPPPQTSTYTGWNLQSTSILTVRDCRWTQASAAWCADKEPHLLHSGPHCVQGCCTIAPLVILCIDTLFIYEGRLKSSWTHYSESELYGGAVTVSFSKYLPWQVMHFLQRSTHFSKTCCRPLITSKFLASEPLFHVCKSPEISWGEIWTIWRMF